jgi:hypothetical protein
LRFHLHTFSPTLQQLRNIAVKGESRCFHQIRILPSISAT